MLVLGSEGKGLRRAWPSACDQLVSLPVRGRVESLNVSAAAAVLLFEGSPARRAPGTPSSAADGQLAGLQRILRNVLQGLTERRRRRIHCCDIRVN